MCARTALIVDDHPEFRAVARLVIEGPGLEVVAEVADGEAALAVMAETHPDVVLLACRKSPPTVVLTSSSDAASYGERLASAPVRGFIPKDQLTPQALAELLCETPSSSRG